MFKLKTPHTTVDGAMGTELQKKGLTQDPVLYNLSHPQAIIDIHKSYLSAGADIITANTFGAYSHKHTNSHELIRMAIKNGREALYGHKNKWLALDMGPTGQMLEPYGDMTEDECFEIFLQAAKAGADADLIIIETMMDLNELTLAVKAAKETGLPIFTTMAFDKNGRTMMGNTIDGMLDALDNKVQAIGLNCGMPNDYAPLAAELKSKTKLPIIIQPNAGLPHTSTQGNAIYNLTPQEFAAQLSAMEIAIVGGCCGTSPEYIKLLSKSA